MEKFRCQMISNHQHNAFRVYKLRIKIAPQCNHRKKGTSERRVSSKHKYKINFLITNSLQTRHTFT